MSSFEPELGQALFSNSNTQEHEVPRYVEGGLGTIGQTIGLLRSSDENKAWYCDPCNNVGGDADFSNDVFTMRAYCWCEGEKAGHENGCPPNFETEGITICWYKHSQRGLSCDRLISPKDWQEILVRCLASLKT